MACVILEIRRGGQTQRRSWADFAQDYWDDHEVIDLVGRLAPGESVSVRLDGQVCTVRRPLGARLNAANGEK